MALISPPDAGPAASRGLALGRKALLAAIAVLVVGLVITGTLAVVTFRGYHRTEKTLLALQTTLIADAGEAEDQLFVEDHLGGAASLAGFNIGLPVAM